MTFDYYGPFLNSGEPPPPDALAAPIRTDVNVGDRVRLRLDAPARGLDLGFVNRLGELEVPAWDLLQAASFAVLRHRSDPAQDIRVAVRSRVAFGRLRFTSPDLSFEDLATSHPEHTGPFLQPPDYHFAVEARQGTRLPGKLAADHQAWVPLHPQPTAIGNPGTSVYTPHPGEVLLTDMAGPFFDEHALGPLVRATQSRLGPAAAVTTVVALVLLALAGLLQWLHAGRAAAHHIFGAGTGVTVIFLAAATLGPSLSLATVLPIAEVAIGIAVVLGLTRLLAGLPRRE